MEKIKCKDCSKSIILTEHNKETKLCYKCKTYKKKCKICGKEMYAQAVTCSKECAYELKKQSWLLSCGTTHNFSKNSSSRKKWEEKLFEEEGVINNGQRNWVKEKIKNTCIEKYGVANVFSLKSTHDKIRLDHENSGIWIPLSELSEFQIYRKNVESITNSNIKKYSKKYLKKSILLENNNTKDWSEKYSVDHIYSVSDGFKNKISPEIIGSIVNIQIILFIENSAKNKKSHMSLNKLIEKYKTFLNENKID